MKWEKAIGEGTALGSIVFVIYLFLRLTYAGLTTGSYRVVIDSNTLNEHYFELALVIIGLICYVKTRKIKFTLRPRGRKVAELEG